MGEALVAYQSLKKSDITGPWNPKGITSVDAPADMGWSLTRTIYVARPTRHPSISRDHAGIPGVEVRGSMTVTESEHHQGTNIRGGTTVAIINEKVMRIAVGDDETIRRHL